MCLLTCDFTLVVLLVICFPLSVCQYDDMPRIYSLHIRSEIQFRFATTLVTSRVANPSNYSQETTFEVMLPEEAFISNFTLEIDGVVYPGIVKEKEQARKEYEKAKKKGRTTGLVSQKPRETRQFKVEITTAALSKVTFNLTYQELLKRVRGVYEHRVFINPGYPVKDLQIAVGIQESRDITRIHIPPIRNLQGLLTNDYKEEPENGLAIIDHPSSRRALIRYSPGVSEQGDSGVSGQFVVQYDIDRSLDGGDVLVVNGYFVHFLAPDIKKSIPKDILFILDVSGSMSGRKIEQMKESMYGILDELQEGDRFNIMTFSSDVMSYASTMTDVTDGEILKAKQSFVMELKANGGTNINGAILDGIKRLQSDRGDDERTPIIVFLTDGEATSGVTQDSKILENLAKANEGTIPIFSLAFGRDADWNLVQKMASQNNGVARKIYEDSDADLQIRGFYDELAVVLLNNVSVKYLGGNVDEESITKSNFKNYFKGSEMVVAGRLADIDVPNVNLEIFSDSADGALVLTADRDANLIDLSQTDGQTDMMDFETITEKTWAYLTIKQLLERTKGESNATAVMSFEEKAKELSLKYGFVTPLTSMVVVKPELDEDMLANTRPSTPPTTPPTTTRVYYRRKGYGRGYGGGGGGDPHFMVRIRNIEHPLCFDFPSKAGEIINLLTDLRKHVIINGEIIGGENGHHGQKTYMGKIAIQTSHHVIMITPEVIVFDARVFKWNEKREIHFGGHKCQLFDKGTMLTVQFNFGAQLQIRRHTHNKGSKAGLNYLNFYVNHEDGFSSETKGLIGQFVNRHKHIFLRKTFTSEGGKHMAHFKVKEGAKFHHNDSILQDDHDAKNNATFIRIAANLVTRAEVIEKGTAMCWLVHESFAKMLVGDREVLLKESLIAI